MVAFRLIFFAVIATIATPSAQATLADQIHGIIARQTSPAIDPNLIPAQCKTICLPINDLSDGTCTTLDCICGSRISSSVSGCLQCALDASGLASFVPQFQVIYDNYADSCRAGGQPVPSFTFKLDSTGTTGAASPLPSATSGTGSTTSNGGSGSSNSNGGSSGSGGGGGLGGLGNGASHIHVTIAGMACVLATSLFLAA
ncbi:hypothetical protein P691DRAFT_832195 [Macrolepiota fuliginosa MF-IS2]|uniref:Extracellular membrane protein CFEM domain-containing protein n=1 Tax=Macrolepiota fuliginosa MF-IS2 TaxID=1400762 RepID=A0A9P5X5S6_9AGAR|nr:hypothetical protein P691DRAFT_832195 [Macrolepiota fuliginosa MF-IS2]